MSEFHLDRDTQRTSRGSESTSPVQSKALIHTPADGMLHGATVACLLAPLASLITRLALGWDLWVPLYLALFFAIPLGFAWMWRWRRWKGVGVVDVTVYSTIALVAALLLGETVLGISYMVSAIGIYHRSRRLSVYGGLLGLACILFYTLWVREAPSTSELVAQIVIQTFIVSVVTAWNVYLAQIFHERDETFLHERRRADEQRRLYRLLAESATDLVGLHEPDGTFSYVSPSASRLLGYAPEEFLGKSPLNHCHPDDRARVEKKMKKALSGRGVCVTFRSKTKEGREIWFETTFQPIFDEEGRIRNLQSASRDITERKAYEHELVHQALHDPLTGLPNRTLFYRRIRKALAQTEVKDADMAVVYLDLDHFKRINDSLGHLAGDDLLIQAAQRISACLGPDDTVARIGGDEFAIHLAHIESPEHVGQVATRILNELVVPFVINGRTVMVSPSVGISMNRGRSGTVEDLLREADTAMYQAKKEGGARFVIYESDMQTYGISRLHLESELAEALQTNQLLLHYQPIVALDTEEIVGAEALVRWKHPEMGLLAPSHFIPVAEMSGLIIPLGRWVMEEACRQLAEWEAAGRLPSKFTLCVNLSPRQLDSPDLVNEFREILAATGVKPQRVQLEITEGSLVREDDTVVQRLQDLKEVGFRLAIDDYGTGFSSIGYLKWFPFDCLKIARSFVQEVHKNPRDLALASSIISLAHDLGLTVNAEGIEEPRQAETLAQRGCHYAQGFHFGHPVPAAEIERILPFADSSIA